MKPTLPLFLALLLPAPLGAANLTWDGGGGEAAWTTGANWVGDPATVTLGTDSIQTFHTAGAGNLTNFLGADATIGTLAFNTAASGAVNIVLADAAVGGAARVLTFDVTTGSAAIRIAAGATGNYTLGGDTGSISLADNLTIAHSGTNTLAIDRPITGSGTGLTKTGGGILRLAGENTFTGSTTFAGGTLNLDYSLADNSKLSDTAPLILGGGAITLSGGTHTEVVASTTLAAGGTQLSSSTSSAVLALGEITRQPYSTLNIAADNIATTTSPLVNGILGGAITRFGRFAVKSGDNIVINSGETGLPAGATTATENYTTGGNLVRTEDGTINSLRYQAGVAPLKALDLGGFTLTIQSGGLLLVNNNPNLVLNGTLKGSPSGELIVHSVGNIAQNIDAKISDNGGATALVKAGPAALKLGNVANDFTGGVFINEGSLTVGASGVIPDTAIVTILNGGSLDIGTYVETVGKIILDGGSIGGGTGTLTATAAYDLRSGAVNGKLAGAVPITKTTAGTVVIGTATTITGGTTIDGGTLQLGVANIFGTGNGLPLTINSGGTLDINGKGLTISSFSSSGTLDNTSSSGATVQIGKNNVGGTISGPIRNSGGGNLSLWKWGAGQTIITGQNTYTGLTWIVSGTVTVDSISSLAAPAPSALGAPTDLASGAIRFSSGANPAGTLRYIGSATTTDRPLDLRGTTSGASVDASGTGPITFTSDLILTGSGAKTFVLRGANTDANTFAGKISDSAGGATSLFKNNPGTWLLTAANDYTGTTVVNDGKLLVNGVQTGTGAVTINTAGTLGGTGTLPAAVDLTGTLSPGDGIGTLTTGALALNTGATLAVEINTSAVTADKLVVSGSVTRPGTAANLVLTDLGGNVALSAGTRFVIVDYSGLWDPADVVSYGGNPVADGSTVTLGANTFTVKYNDGGDFTLTAVGGGASPYDTFINGYAAQIPNSADRAPGADPDADGRSNLLEFALNGNPASGSDNGKLVISTADTSDAGTLPELTVTLAVRSGAVASAGPNGSVILTGDGITYTIQGSLTLAAPFNSAVSEATPALPLVPAPSAGWTARTFRLDASDGLSGKGFLRVGVSQ